MADKKKRELYSFSVEINEPTEKEVQVEREVEVEEEVEVEKKRKNKETGKMEAYTEKVMKPVKRKETTTEIRTEEKARELTVVFKRPTRTQLEDGDMFYSIWLNKFIKMGLLTRAMLAKQHIDIGGTLDEDEKKHYSQMYVKLFEKQMDLQRFALKMPEEMSGEEKERRNRTVSDIGLIRKELTDFETVQASMFEHTADIKARNKTIIWYLLCLAFWRDPEDEEGNLAPMFPGEGFEDKYQSYKDQEEDDNPLFWKSIDKLSSLATIWYMSGVQKQEDFDALLEEVSQEAMLDEPIKTEE